VLEDTVSDSAVTNLRNVRNYLAHRGDLPRQHFLAVGSADRPSAHPSNPLSLASEQLFDAPIDSETAGQHVRAITEALNKLLPALQAFLRGQQLQ